MGENKIDILPDGSKRGMFFSASGLNTEISLAFSTRICDDLLRRNGSVSLAGILYVP